MVNGWPMPPSSFPPLNTHITNQPQHFVLSELGRSPQIFLNTALFYTELGYNLGILLNTVLQNKPERWKLLANPCSI